MSSFIITLLHPLIYFIFIFVCRAPQPADTDRRPLLRLSMAWAGRRWLVWLEDRVTQQEAPEEPEIIATQQEASERPEVLDEANDQPEVTYRLNQF
jgi:hypothetical protein